MKHRPLILALAVLLFSLAHAEDYPKINVNGYKKWEYREAQVYPRNNYFLGLTQLGGFSPTTTGSPWQERLQLNILGQLTEKLSVSYNISQQPEAPDVYDVKVNYDNKHQLAFGDLTASFYGNEFAAATKYLNGVMITSKDTGYDILAVPSAKLKSQVQNLTAQKGNNTKGPYSLGHGSIVEGSERIELNGVVLQRGRDYIIDYFEGKINFNRILTALDEFKYSYEYTNILDLFFPALSKKDFFGLQGRFTFDPSTWGKKTPVARQITETTVESFPASYPQPALITAEVNVTAEDVLEEESVGKYRLKNVQIVPFSEKIIFKGVILKKNEDYNIKYDEGKITLLLPVLPAAKDPLQVTYNYPKVKEEQEIIAGSGSRGPYDLSFSKILALSEHIFINDRLVVRDYDYTIDYENGRLVFNYNVSNTSIIKTNYRHVVLELPPPPPPPKFKREMTLGVTYLRESAKKGASTAYADNVESRTQQNISSNNNTIYLSRFPLLTSAEGGTLSLKIRSRDLVYGIDYVVPTTEVDPATGYARVIPDTRLAYINDPTDTTDGYGTGTIKILTSLEATDEVTVLYSYNKSISGRFTGFGSGSRGPYYVRNYRNIIPGTEKMEVWTTGSSMISTYVRNSSFEADAGDIGYSISYDKDNPYIMFNKELQPDQNFSIYFQYAAPTAPAGGDISQDVTGFDGSFKFGDFLQFEGAYARTSNDRVITSVGSSEIFTNFYYPTNRLPRLANTPVIENSERVYVNGNLRNRDSDYFIDYSGGQITFYYITLTTMDVVTVDYQYQSQQGIQQSAVAQTGSAYKYGVRSTLLDKLDVSFSRKQISFDFSPLGSTGIGVGSDYNDFSLNLRPQAQDFRSNYTYRETKSPISNSRSQFTRNYERSYSLGVNPLKLLNVSLDIRNLEARGDPSTLGGPLTADNSQNSYSLGVTPATFVRGALSYSQQYNASKSISDDNIYMTGNRNDYLHLFNSLGITDRIRLGGDYQYSETKGIKRVTSETTTARSKSEDTSYDLSTDLTFGRIQRWTAYAKFITHVGRTLIPTPESISEIKNTTYHTEFTPFSMLSTSADYNRQETPSVTVLGRNPKTERVATNVRLSPTSNFSSAWAYSEDLTVNESARESRGRSNTYNANWTILSLSKVKLDSNYNYYMRNSVAPSGTLETTTDTSSFTQGYNMTFTPLSFLSVTPGFAQEEYKNKTSLATRELITRNQTARCHIDLNPPGKVRISADYSNKVTASLTDNVNRPKSNISVRTSLQVFSWGELVHTMDLEENQGEVQAGGTLPQINYRRSANTYNLNINIPQDNPILSSMLLTATLKYVRFENFMADRASDNLDSSLLTFEGTLNF